MDEAFEPADIGKNQGDDGDENDENGVVFGMLNGSFSFFGEEEDDEDEDVDEDEDEDEDEDDAGEGEDSYREVPLSDASSEWALWVQEAFAVKKYAFKDEASARAALENWSFFVKVLTKSNREAAIAGTLFAQTVGLIREAIEVEGGADDRNRRDGEEESRGELWESEGGAEGREGPAVDGLDDEGVIYEVHTTEGPAETAAAAAAAAALGEVEKTSSFSSSSSSSSSLSSVSASESASAATWCVDGGDVRGAASPLRDERGAAALDDWICVRLLTDPRGEVVATRNSLAQHGPRHHQGRGRSAPHQED